MSLAVRIYAKNSPLLLEEGTKQNECLTCSPYPKIIEIVFIE
jgi:hypothetical protein